MRRDTTSKGYGLAIAAAAVLALPASLIAQETQRTADTTAQRDTTMTQQARSDTTGQDTTQWGRETNADPEVQNPPGYRGMERPVNVFPEDSASDSATAGRVEDRATGTYDDSTWNDSTAARQNPAGYRGMERAAGGTEADSAAIQREVEQYKRRLSELGYKVTKMSKSERKSWKDSNTAATGDNRAGSDTTQVGETSPKVPKDSTRRLPAARGDTTGQAGSTTTDTTGR